VGRGANDGAASDLMGYRQRPCTSSGQIVRESRMRTALTTPVSGRLVPEGCTAEPAVEGRALFGSSHLSPCRSAAALVIRGPTDVSPMFAGAGRALKLEVRAAFGVSVDWPCLRARAARIGSERTSRCVRSFVSTSETSTCSSSALGRSGTGAVGDGSDMVQMRWASRDGVVKVGCRLPSSQVRARDAVSELVVLLKTRSQLLSVRSYRYVLGLT